ncbi:MAG: bifunctional methylenetetrahydrofolate dehydrogenase/methenyltetrahydrofolate cyclohydrolase FolD [Planctomycetota bacterium]|nr:bifunctional methylenetetrahydrofolate dehydrogenase/methenyltetrahydrofolate cyclohydrolase FolD [Planctomycetota bacterium]MEC8513368.1 bifunctional methylenetetrahydrofolate dehydrogenase/methenyltetrahydrofolate cyclohydrolase FolD [Planctomycetota bacterium]
MTPSNTSTDSSEALVLDGKATAYAVRSDVAVDAAALTAQGRAPGLAVVLVGDDPASQVYVRSKDKAATEAGFAVSTIRMSADVTQTDVESIVDQLNADDSVDGILVQLPLPRQLDSDAVVDRIAPEKDVDGLTAANVARLSMGRPGLVPCTPAGCIEILDRHGIDLSGKNVVVIGRSQLVGKPFAQLALARNATVTVCHSRTTNLAEHCRGADVIVAAVGVRELVQGDWVKEGAIVLDVGINRNDEGKLVGDVHYASAAARAAAITPVPGGIGPMTIAMLLANTLKASAARQGIQLGSPA